MPQPDDADAPLEDDEIRRAARSLEGGEPARSETSQTMADSDQTSADSDEGSSGSDEALAYADQEISDRDQAASDADQVTADRQERDNDGDPEVTALYEESRRNRAEATDERAASSAQRDATHTERTRQELNREVAARQRDRNAITRDRIADDRDDAVARAEQALATQDGTAAFSRQLKISAAVRGWAAADRARAAGDRVRAAADREEAADARRHARVDAHRADAGEMSAVYPRDVGLATLQHEIDRCRRASEPFVLVCVGIGGFADADQEAEPAIDEALVGQVVKGLAGELPSYDPIVRISGDELLCGFIDTELSDAERRVEELRSAVPEGCVSVGLAALEDRDTLESIAARADLAMYSDRRNPRG